MPTHETSFPLVPGRRNRDTATIHAAPSSDRTSTMASSQQSRTAAEAKGKFVAGVSRGISVLMKEHGYSRERAQTALLREIVRGDISPPDDKEVFQAMSSHCLGIESAARALTVSKALQRETTERKVSMLQAIDDLTSKLSEANLIRMDRGSPSQSPVPASPCETTVSIPPRSSEVRIQPVPPVVLPRNQQTTRTTTACPNAATIGRKTKLANKTAKQRKRPVDDINKTRNEVSSSKNEEESPNSFSTARERSDSLSEVEAKKFGGQPENTSNAIRPPSPAAVVRAKRGRVEDTEPQTAMKRSRAATL